WPPLSGPYKELLNLARMQPDDSPMREAAAPVMQQFITFYEEILANFDDAEIQQRLTCPRLCFVAQGDAVGAVPIGQTIIDERTKLERFGWDVRVLGESDPSPDQVDDPHFYALRTDVFIPLLSEWLDNNLLTADAGQIAAKSAG